MKLHLERLLDGVSLRRRELARLRTKWGKPGAKDGWLASRYFDLTRPASARECVDEKTWVDLELPRIFTHLDSTETPVGGQVLFRQLREYVADPKELAERYSSFAILRSNPSLCEEIRLRLATLRADSNAAIAGFLFGPPPEKPKYFRILPLFSLLSVATLVAVLTLPAPIWLWFAVVAINTVIILRVSPYVHRDAETLRACHQLLRVADGLSTFERRLPSVQQLQRLVAEAPRRAAARKALRLPSMPRGALAESLYLWLNLAFLVELIAYAWTIDRFLHVRAHLASAFESVGSLDAAVAVASYLEWRPDHCQPELSDARVIAIEEGHHPLLDAPVKNSIRLAERSALVTGSNMAGKTTFIKMVGINVILGRTLGFCFARSASIPSARVMASIRGEHSVESGKSHYFAEIEAIHSFIENARRGDRDIFVIDELFNGTNTVERLAAARAVLEALCQSAQVLVTTHDVELQDVLSDRYDLYHFQEDPDVEGFFDYRLRSGATGTRNAIRLLERMGFPSEIVRNAMLYAAGDIGRE
jgi:DNA mismatch repair ATPase MutS